MKRLISIMLAIFLLVCMTTIGFADGQPGDANQQGTDAESYLQSNVATITDTKVIFRQTWLNNYLTVENTGNTTNYTIDGHPLFLKNGKTLESFEAEIARAITGDKTVGNVSNITDGLNVTADTNTAAVLLSGFTDIISLGLGVIATLVIVGMTVFSAFDIAYIAFPVFRNKCEDAKVNGGNSMMTKKNSNGETGLRWVTDDAQYAISQGTIENGKSPWAIYFKKRVMSYILLAIILFILLTGNISLITNIALKVVSGIMNVLNGMA